MSRTHDQTEAPWQQPTVYVEARNQLDPVLLKLGFKREYERFDWHAFGSICAVYVREHGGQRVRIVWNGKDGQLIVEQFDDGHYIAVSATGSSLDRETADNRAKELQKVYASLARHLETADRPAR